tara:strand:+ start:1045 stop:1623 length:579 start_codon:yes stop_codon:yes gene_type:complete
MILKKASAKAVEYSCKNFHYAKTRPIVQIAYSVFNDNLEWCGCITFGGGASSFFGVKYNLKQGEYLELSRMALNGKQESTSKAMSIAIKLLKKHKPLVKLLISYADKAQNHYGIIYQACNWYFVDESESSGIEVFWKNKWRHSRISSKISKKEWAEIPKRKKKGKRKYLYPLTKNFRKYCELNKKEYPKKMR